MATILPVIQRHKERGTLSGPTTMRSLPEHFSAFQEILELACSRVDALRSTHPEFDRRAMTRTKVALPAECSGPWGASRCLISDFGEGGLALVCGHPHAIGDRIRVSWYFGVQRWLAQVECTVRHVTGVHVGIEFVDVSPDQRARLLESLSDALPVSPCVPEIRAVA